MSSMCQVYYINSDDITPVTQCLLSYQGFSANVNVLGANTKKDLLFLYFIYLNYLNMFGVGNGRGYCAGVVK